MNPLILPTSSLFLPLSQLNPHCNRLLNSLHDARVSQRERVLCEQTLWNEVKKIRSLNDTSIFLYLIGYYHTILFQVTNLTTPDDLFQYHVLIRLGDLNRYADRIDVAEYYYCNARNLFPYFGHAYNQLGLLTKPANCYKCCYYYARAARSSERPLNKIADSNLRIAVGKYNCEILNHILNSESFIGSEIKQSKLPKSAFEWFYVMVVAIYADNIKPIAKLFLCYMNENFSTQRSTTVLDHIRTTIVYCDLESYILLATFDILLDWLNLGSQEKTLCHTISNELRQIKTCIQTVIASIRANSIISSGVNNSGVDVTTISSMETNSSKGSGGIVINSTLRDASSLNLTDSSSSSGAYKLPALPHDYVMRGFGPLNKVHESLVFCPGFRARMGLDDEEGTSVDSQKFIQSDQLLQLLIRIRTKLNSLSPFIKRRTRNIALESILSNKAKNADN